MGILARIGERKVYYMSYAIKARTSSKCRRKNTVLIALGTILSVTGVIMLVYSLIKASWLFAASYFIALILLVTYIVIRINTVYVTYLATDRESIIMKNWSNDFLPYDVENKVKFLAEFIPSTTKVTEIPINEIEKVVIGTKSFIKRTMADDTEFLQRIAVFENSKDYYQKRTISAMDIFYVRVVSGESYYMPIMNFNTKMVKKLLGIMLKVKPDIEMVFAGREYRNFRMQSEK